MLRRTTSMPCVRTIYTGRPLQVMKSLDEAPKEFSCGIPAWKVQRREPPPTITEVPAQLVRPPCMPGSKPGPYQSCLQGMQGLYCPPCRIKYMYPPFSENIDFIPSSIIPPCWWRLAIACTEDEGALAQLPSLTSSRWPCAYD